jgi:DNA topoisomerase-1
MKNIVIVESPSKAKIIKKYINNNNNIVDKFGLFEVIASYGHIRDLPKKILGIDINNNFKAKYVEICGKYSNKTLKSLKENIENSEKVWIASDLDREGEAIAYHIKEYFKLKGKYKRIAFNEITPLAIENAIFNSRKIDMNMVKSQETRRILDRLVGYKISPLLWKNFETKSITLSAGRVQSAVLSIIINRENEIKEHKTESYYNIIGEFNIVKNTKLETSNKINKKLAKLILNDIKESDNFSLYDISYKSRNEHSPYPFITSSLQQTASGSLKMSINQVMIYAQALYENGLISYMRTDSYNLSDSILEEIKNYIIENKSEEYLCFKNYEKKNKKTSQEAHEAIRPTNIKMTKEKLREKIKDGKYKILDNKHLELYSLIWNRTVASQMSPAKFYDLKVKIMHIETKRKWIGREKIYYFDGYLSIYEIERNKNIRSNIDIDKYINKIKDNKDELNSISFIAKNTWSVPLPHYSESSIIKTLDDNGIGRPSTYASIISKLYDKKYILKRDIEGLIARYDDYILKKDEKDMYLNIKKESEEKAIINEKSKLIPQEIGYYINDFMSKYFSSIIKKDFTSNMEEKLDLINSGEENYLDVLNNFYNPFLKLLENVEIKTKNERKEQKGKIKMNSENYSKSYLLHNNTEAIVRIAKYGPVIQLKNILPNNKDKFISLTKYLELKNKDIEEIDLDDIIFLMSFPINIGEYSHKIDKEYVSDNLTIHIGQYGFYLKWNKKNYTIFKNKIGMIFNKDEDAIIDYFKKMLLKKS